MERVLGTNVKTGADENGGFISVDWTCPHCGGDNLGFYYTDNGMALMGDFEGDFECDDCGRRVTVECRDAGSLW